MFMKINNHFANLHVLMYYCEGTKDRTSPIVFRGLSINDAMLFSGIPNIPNFEAFKTHLKRSLVDKLT